MRLSASCRSASSREISKPSRSVDAVASCSWADRLVDGRLDLDQAGLARRATGGEVGADQVALARHGGDVGQVGDQLAGGGRSSTTATLKSSRASAPRRISAGASTTSRAYVACAGQRGPRGSSTGPPPSSSPARPRSSPLRWAIASTAASAPGDDDGVGGGAEGRRDGRLVAVLHARAARPPTPAARRPCRSAASSAPAPSLRLRPSSSASRRATQPGAVTIGLLGLLAGLGEALVDVVEGRDGGLVLRVEALLAGVEPGDLGLERREVAAGPARRGRPPPRGRQVRRPISSAAAAARDLRALTWPCSRASPSRRSAAAR